VEYLFIFPALISRYFDGQQFYLASKLSCGKIRQVNEYRKMELNSKKPFFNVNFINQLRGEVL